MYDLKLLKKIKLYTDAMALGINPLTGEYVNSSDSLSSEKIQQCMYHISQIVDDVIKHFDENSINNKNNKVKRVPFSITLEQKKSIVISDEPIGINELARRINSVIDITSMRSVSGTKIASWLAENGYLSVIKTPDNRTHKITNSKSTSLGISTRERINIETGEIYNQVVYNKFAQQYIIDNIEEINKRKHHR